MVSHREKWNRHLSLIHTPLVLRVGRYSHLRTTCVWFGETCHSLNHYFRFPPFFFFTPPPEGAGAGTGVSGRFPPCVTGEAAVACEGGAGRAAEVGLSGLFVIFWIRERFNASKRPRKIEECVLNFKHVASSVILRTSFPSEDFHFTLYRVFLGELVYKFSAASWYSCHELMYTMIALRLRLDDNGHQQSPCVYRIGVDESGKLT